jgi:CheY-like chemotaxis protein
VRILLVEDDAALANFVCQGLQAEDYAVDVAEDGERARVMGSEIDYDLMILDLNLPRVMMEASPDTFAWSSGIASSSPDIGIQFATPYYFLGRSS